MMSLAGRLSDLIEGSNKRIWNKLRKQFPEKMDPSKLGEMVKADDPVKLHVQAAYGLLTAAQKAGLSDSKES